MDYGKELIIDIHNCKVLFTRKMLKRFFKKLCKLIDMEREDLHFWDYKGMPEEYKAAPAHLKGITAVQFIKTSNITIHTLDQMCRVYINIFSCKGFNSLKASDFCENYFSGTVVNFVEVQRK